MKRYRKVIITAVLTLFIIFSFNYFGYANSAEPPSILIIVPNATDDLSIKLNLSDGEYEARVVDKVIEKYYTFYISSMVKRTNVYNFVINTENDNFEIELTKPIKTYNNIYTLDLKTKSLTEGKLLSRSIFLVTMRLTLTLIIEAFIFWIFGFKNRKSWMVFFITNIVTQGALNIWLNGFEPIMSYVILTLIVGEFFVFIAELIAFLLFCKEHGRMRRVLYVLTANFASLFLGGYLISILPF